MSSDGMAVRAEGLGKRYRFGRRNAYPTLREALVTAAAAAVARISPFRSPAGADGRSPETFWALRDVSFEVARGEVLGILGPNGAGKSTLLKILSRITDPTTGYAEIRGRFGSLLDVGTGFHPELTGRENVFLNGAILGMTRADVVARFDEIVAFAETEAFVDTPVKHYSTGMYLRLAFAVAAHLEPDVLIVDEVLAVGDAAFQDRCLGKIGEVARDGRTVLFVTHNMAVVQRLCTRAILLRHGTTVADGRPAHVIGTYLAALDAGGSMDLAARRGRPGTGRVRLVRVEVSRGDDGRAGALATGHPARISLHVDGVLPQLSCSFTIYDRLGQPVTYFDSIEHGAHDVAAGASRVFCCDIDELLLVPGRYRVNAAVSSDGELHDHVEAAAVLHVEEGIVRGRPVARDPAYGSIVMPHRWSTPA
jgi:lipopolysaccharide transport system ATP-binding protein